MKATADLLASLACIIAASAIIGGSYMELRSAEGISIKAKVWAGTGMGTLAILFGWGAWRLGWMIAGGG